MRILTHKPLVVVVGETDVADPNAPEFNLFHAYGFLKGHITLFHTLPVRPGSVGNYSYPNSINDFRFTAGWSENGILHPLNGFPEIRAVVWNDNGGITFLVHGLVLTSWTRRAGKARALPQRLEARI